MCGIYVSKQKLQNAIYIEEIKLRALFILIISKWIVLNTAILIYLDPYFSPTIHSILDSTLSTRMYDSFN